ncbi:MAG TPA: prepilin-type N-terminal cleavage/methylation domain-containing protein [Candidatus Polarisedimenticolia bacterium]|nr:prepilin-type N-terminal cleavage/methylation domain-containing protein [Candidatus Polarisedimenticolia bacterium]
MRRRDCAGFSLVEMLVASAIFAIVASVAFIFFSGAQKSYKSGGNFAEQQQATRVAFDRMIADLRLAGFNTNPDGDASRVDEQVEGAWDTAVTIRGDFDFEDVVLRSNPEASLPGTVYNVVSTGNDEVVTYVLAKPGPQGPATLTLRVDADRPRTRTVKTVTIPNVALVQNDPPYTLYRVTLRDVAGAFLSSPQPASQFVYETVAENIRSMTFRYLPDSGAVLGPDTPANPADDIGGDDAGILPRSRIRRISVSLVGMTPDEDLDYVDASDATATTHFRKFDLKSDVNAENLGRAGVRDIDITPPPAPANLSLVPGHCKGMLVKWDTPSAASGVTAYDIKYWPSGNPSAFTTGAVTYPHAEYGVVDFEGHGFLAGMTQGTTYCFQARARDIMGNQSGWAPTTAPCAAVAEASNPAAPQNLAATGGTSLAPIDSQVTLTWDEVKNNANDVPNDPDFINAHTLLRDGAGYKLYRDTTSTFTPDDATNLVAGPATLQPGVLTFTDTAVANCQPYYYKLKAADTCDVVGAASVAAVGQAQTNIVPSIPTGLSGQRSGAGAVTLTWNAVTAKADASAVHINLYRVYRYFAPRGTSPASLSTGAFTLRGTSSNPGYTDALSTQDEKAVEDGQSLYYVVTAADLCGNESSKPMPVEVSCDFNGSLVVSPGDGDANGGSVRISMSVIGSDTYVRGRVRIANPQVPGLFVYDETSSAYPFQFRDWNTTVSGLGKYQIYWEVQNAAGCVQTLTTTFEATENLSCQITPTSPDLSPTNGKPSDQSKKLTWDIVNSSGRDLSIVTISASWTSVLGPHKLVQIEYPTGTIVKSYGLLGPLVQLLADFTSLPLMLLDGVGSGCSGSSCVRMSMVWDSQMMDSAGQGETITVTYGFKDPSGLGGTCSFSIKPTP